MSLLYKISTLDLSCLMVAELSSPPNNQLKTFVIIPHFLLAGCLRLLSTILGCMVFN